MYDILIIGAGICGTFLARDLSRYELRVALVDKEDDIACGSTMANSAILHSGHDPRPGTLKARFNLRGSAMYEDICRDLGCAYRRTGAFVAAASPEECRTLDILESQARDRHVPVHRLSRAEALAQEPLLSDHVLEVLDLPSTAIFTPWEVAIALTEEAVLNGTDLFLEHKVTSIEKAGALCDSALSHFFRVHTRKPDGGSRTLEARRIIDAAGVWADRIYAMVSDAASSDALHFSINPRKGEYFVLDREATPLVSRVIYPAPSEKGKGVLAVPTIHGNLLLGPSADFVDDRDDVGNTAEALRYVRTQIARTVRDIPFQKVIRSFAGLRATGSTHDFIVQEAPDVPGFILAAAIESPGLTAAPAISEYIVQELLAPHMELKPRIHYIRRRPFLSLKGLSPEEYNRRIREDPSCGRMVCRCEQVTEAEVLDAIHRPAGARTLKGIKKRCRPGMGRCQGGFCEPLITELLCRELGKTPAQLLHGSGSPAGARSQ